MLTICIWYSLPIRKVIAMQFQLFGPCPKGENGCVIFFFLYLYTKLFLKLMECLNSATIHTDIKISHYVQCAYVVICRSTIIK